MLKYQPLPLLENAMKTRDAVQSRDNGKVLWWSTDGDRQTLDLLYYTRGGRLDGLIEVQ